ITVRETVPDWVMKRVREVVMADLTPEALQTRMRRGDIYPLDRAEKALANFFRPGNLIALRELALQEVAQEVDRSLETYLDQEGGERKLGVRERFAVAKAVAGFVREKHITQVVFGHSAVKGWKRYLYLNAIHKFLRDAPPVDVHIVTQQSS